MNQAPLPEGLWYEKARDRYRIRLYKHGRVVHRSYHRNREDALATYAAAKAALKALPKPRKEPTLCRKTLLATLQNSAQPTKPILAEPKDYP